MNLLLLGQFGVLAEGWGQLIGVIAVVGFYVFSAIVKKIGESGQSDEEKEKARQAARRIHEQIAKGKTAAQVEEANRRRLERKLPYAKAVKNRESMSEWDRQQEEKRQRLTQSRQNELRGRPGEPVTQKNARIQIETPPAPPIPVAQAIDEDAEELKRQQYYAKAQRAQQVRRRSQMQAQQVAAKSTRTAVKPKKAPAKATVQTRRTSDVVRNLLNNPNQLRSAILLKEILDKPVAMRDIY
jgi:hypothetical protein